MWIFPNLPQNVDKIPNSKGPGPRTKIGCDGPDLLLVGSWIETITIELYT